MWSKLESSFPERVLFPRKKIPLPRLEAYLQHKTVLITGASYGIGEATARLLATGGVTLILSARTKEKLELLQDDLQRQGATVHIFPADLYDIRQTEQLLAYILQSGFRVDVFISNAGKSICRPVEESLDRFCDVTRTLSLNYYAPVRLMLGLIPLLKHTKGQTIHVSALNVLLPPAPYWSAYQASKTAADQWFRTAAFELKPAGIRVTPVYLPLVRTRMIGPVKAYRNMPAMSAEQAAIVIARCILGRKKAFKPWWSAFARCFSYVLGGRWQHLSGRFIQGKNEKTD